MRCYSKILHISYKDHVTNEEARAKIQQAIGPHQDRSWRSQRDTNCSGMVMFSVYQVWPKPSLKAQRKGEENKADRGRGGKTTSGNGQAWSSASPRGQWRTGENGESWFQNHLWCPNDPRGKGIDDDYDETKNCRFKAGQSSFHLANGTFPVTFSVSAELLRFWIFSVFVNVFAISLNKPHSPQHFCGGANALAQNYWTVTLEEKIRFCNADLTCPYKINLKLFPEFR